MPDKILCVWDIQNWHGSHEVEKSRYNDFYYYKVDKIDADWVSFEQQAGNRVAFDNTRFVDLIRDSGIKIEYLGYESGDRTRPYDLMRKRAPGNY